MSLTAPDAHDGLFPSELWFRRVDCAKRLC